MIIISEPYCARVILYAAGRPDAEADEVGSKQHNALE